MALFDLDHPTCLCGLEMRLRTVVPVAPVSGDPHLSEVHTFECLHCKHELRVMHDIPSPPLALKAS
jgi:hypothetical protein